jgi:orotate phosphoribosyltransferase
MLYGPAYKGIPLVSATSIAYSKLKQDIPFAFNRKEAKDHGEGGLIVGSSLQSNVLIIDDVITAGTSVRESVEIIKSMNATPAGVLIALDRQETGKNNSSAIQEINDQFGIPVISIISLNNIIAFLELDESSTKQLELIKQYRLNYGF